MKNSICPICGKPYQSYYNKTCGSLPCKTALKKITNIQKYGHECNLHGPEERPLILAKLSEKYGYGITNVSQIPSVKEKKARTCMENFGVPWPMQSGVVLEKSKKTVLEKYGADNYFKTDCFDKHLKSLGLRRNEEMPVDEKRYIWAVSYWTDKCYNKHIDSIDPDRLRGKDYHIDHRFSINAGFKNGINPKIISDPFNLQIMPARDNIRKYKRCSITLEELLQGLVFKENVSLLHSDLRCELRRRSGR